MLLSTVDLVCFVWQVVLVGGGAVGVVVIGVAVDSTAMASRGTLTMDSERKPFTIADFTFSLHLVVTYLCGQYCHLPFVHNTCIYLCM